MEKLTDLAARLPLLAVLSGNLPWVLKKVRVAQIKLLQESQASKWGKPWVPSYKY